MINREMRKAFILTYPKTVDDYGQINKDVPEKKPVEITLRLYKHSQVEDIRFNDVTHTGLTYNKTITDANKIEINGDIYCVIFVNNEGRLAQLYLKNENTNNKS